MAGMSSTQIVLLALVVAVMTMVMLSTRRRIIQSRGSSRPDVRQRYAELQQKSRGARDLETVMAEFDQLARQVHGRLDTRFAKLEMVIRDADERIDKLSRLIRAADGSPTLDLTLGEEASGESLSDNTKPDQERHAPIFRLSDSGLSAAQIAREVGRTTGEIELILALQRTKKQADPLTAGSLSPEATSAT